MRLWKGFEMWLTDDYVEQDPSITVSLRYVVENPNLYTLVQHKNANTVFNPS